MRRWLGLELGLGLGLLTVALTLALALALALALTLTRTLHTPNPNLEPVVHCVVGEEGVRLAHYVAAGVDQAAPERACLVPAEVAWIGLG